MVSLNFFSTELVFSLDVHKRWTVVPLTVLSSCSLASHSGDADRQAPGP